MHVVKSVGVMSVAKIMGLIYGCLGLIFVPFFLIVGLVGSMAGQQKSPFAGILGIFAGRSLARPLWSDGIHFRERLARYCITSLPDWWVALSWNWKRAEWVVPPYPMVPPPTPGI